MKKRFFGPRKKIDVMTEELIGALSGHEKFDFKTLFLLIYPKLKERNAVSGGEEMLRLRAYEKLQQLVQTGNVEKANGQYSGIVAALAVLSKQLAAEHCQNLLQTVRGLHENPA